ncbi:hypothetical protein JCM9279_003434 [Rhodotorula babjevae]
MSGTPSATYRRLPLTRKQGTEQVYKRFELTFSGSSRPKAVSLDEVLSTKVASATTLFSSLDKTNSTSTSTSILKLSSSSSLDAASPSTSTASIEVKDSPTSHAVETGKTIVNCASERKEDADASPSEAGSTSSSNDSFHTAAEERTLAHDAVVKPDIVAWIQKTDAACEYVVSPHYAYAKFKPLYRDPTPRALPEPIIEVVEAAAEVVSVVEPVKVAERDQVVDALEPLEAQISLDSLTDDMVVDEADYSTWAPVEPVTSYPSLVEATAPLEHALEVPMDLDHLFSTSPSSPSSASDADLDLMDVDDDLMDIDYPATVEYAAGDAMDVDQAPLYPPPAPRRRIVGPGKTVVSPLGVPLFVPSGMGKVKAAAPKAPLFAAPAPARLDHRDGAQGKTVISPLGLPLFIPTGMGSSKHLAAADRGRPLKNSSASSSSAKARAVTPPRRRRAPVVTNDSDLSAALELF